MDPATGCGHMVRAIGARTYQVTFIGNTNSDGATIRDFAMLRAAEVAMENDASHFRVLADELTVRGMNRPRAALAGRGAQTRIVQMPATVGANGQFTSGATVRTTTPGWGGGVTDTSVICTLDIELLRSAPSTPDAADRTYPAAELSTQIRAKRGVR